MKKIKTAATFVADNIATILMVAGGLCAVAAIIVMAAGAFGNNHVPKAVPILKDSVTVSDSAAVDSVNDLTIRKVDSIDEADEAGNR